MKSLTRKQKQGTGVLGTLAAVATILTLFLTANPPHPAPSPSPSASPTTISYPVNVQANYLNACEASATVVACQCTLTWFEVHVALTQFVSDESQAAQGLTPADLTAAGQACTIGS